MSNDDKVLDFLIRLDTNIQNRMFSLCTFTRLFIKGQRGEVSFEDEVLEMMTIWKDMSYEQQIDISCRYLNGFMNG